MLSFANLEVSKGRVARHRAVGYRELGDFDHLNDCLNKDSFEFNEILIAVIV